MWINKICQSLFIKANKLGLLYKCIYAYFEISTDTNKTVAKRR